MTFMTVRADVSSAGGMVFVGWVADVARIILVALRGDQIRSERRWGDEHHRHAASWVSVDRDLASVSANARREGPGLSISV
jgi:hypothetical protein